MLGSKSSLQGVLRGGEDTTESVAYRLEDVTPTGLHGFPEDLVVASQSNSHRLWAPLPLLGGALYVGEQQSDRAGGWPPPPGVSRKSAPLALHPISPLEPPLHA